MAKEALPTPEQLRQLLAYDPETGGLFWLPRPREFFSADHHWRKWNTRRSGKPALTADDGRGYLKGRVLGRSVRAHRVVWAIVHGQWPEGQIDHINGCRSDNRLSNLRVVTAEANSRNMGRQKRNQSGQTGVHWHSRFRKWCAYIGGGPTHLGYFETVEDAIVARRSAEKMHGYHKNHGRRQASM